MSKESGGLPLGPAIGPGTVSENAPEETLCDG